MDKLTIWHKRYILIIFFTILLAFSVIELGAFTRLTDAGLGCPDWPGCYGHWIVPDSQQALHLYPQNPLKVIKAFTEMIHRYFASGLGLIILLFSLINTILIYKRKFSHLTQSTLIYSLVLLVLAQACLGMWTVTLKLHPTVVMLHLIGGFSTLSLLWLLFLKIRKTSLPHLSEQHRYKHMAIFTTLMLILQIMLGGWTSANYASLVCPDFPLCNAGNMPPLDFHTSFNLFQPLTINFYGGNLSYAARITIHIMHRLGALATTSLILLITLHILIKSQSAILKKIALALISFTCLQIILGIINVLKLTPLPIALLHNAIAACLLLNLLTLIYCTWHEQKRHPLSFSYQPTKSI